MQNEKRNENSNLIAVLEYLITTHIATTEKTAKDLDISYRKANRYLNFLAERMFATKDTRFKTHYYEINWEYIMSLRKDGSRNDG